MIFHISRLMDVRAGDCGFLSVSGYLAKATLTCRWADEIAVNEWASLDNFD